MPDSSSKTALGYLIAIQVVSSIAAMDGVKQLRDERRRGERIATMGHTGNGIDQARAHLHLELNLMLSRQFESWYDTYFKKEPNWNGIYNGINLAGFDIARFYLALRKNPALAIPEFLSSE